MESKPSRNKTHKEQIIRWAEFVKNNPDKWKREHTEFINAQIIKSWQFYERLKKTKNGQSKIKALRQIKANTAHQRSLNK